LLSAATGCSAAFPRHASLLDAEMKSVEELLHAACQVPGVLVPVATKVLHRKRPNLVPMLDNVVLGHYFAFLKRPELVGRSQDKPRAASAAMVALAAFRDDLVDSSAQLNQIAAELVAAGTQVTTMRLLELLVWCAVEPKGYYRNR
jgi:hypothetical protein